MGDSVRLTLQCPECHAVEVVDFRDFTNPHDNYLVYRPLRVKSGFKTVSEFVAYHSCTTDPETGLGPEMEPLSVDPIT